MNNQDLIIEDGYNYLTGDVLVIGTDIEALLRNFENNSLVTYGIEYDKSLYRKGMEGKHQVLHGPITTENISWFKSNSFDIIYVNDIRRSIINFNNFTEIIKPFMHKYTNLYINIIGLNNEYYWNLQETLIKHKLKLIKNGKLKTHIKINLNNE